MRLTFIVSIALNLLLLTTLVAARVDSARVGTGPNRVIDMALSGGESVDDSVGIRTAEELVRVLSHTQLEANEVRALTLSWLEHRNTAAPASPGVPYWQPDFSPALDELVRKTRVEARARNELISVFGPEAASIPAFERVFRPLGAGFTFLGSEAQIALQRHQIERLQSVSGTSALDSSPAGCIVRAGSASVDPRQHAPVPADFSTADSMEYRLRYSPLAEQLRRSGSAASEQEYRALFDLLLRLDFQASPGDQARLRHELRGRMGSQAFDRLQSMRDPLFVHYETYVRGQGFGDTEVEGAYAILNQSQEQLLEILGRETTGEGAVPALSRVREIELERLTQLLGKSAARGLLLVRSRAVSEQAAGTSPAC